MAAVQVSPDLTAERLALVARSTGDAVAILGPGGRIEWVNEAFEAMTGFAADEVVGRRRLDLVRGPFTRTAQFEELSDQLDRLQPVSTEFVTRTSAGVSYWVSLDVHTLVQDGVVTGAVAVERDVTSRRQAQEQARVTLRRAESLTGMLRHEKGLLTQVLSTIPHVVWWKNTDLRYVGANPAYLAMRTLDSQAALVGRTEHHLGDGSAFGEAVEAFEQQVLASGLAVVDQTLADPRGDRVGHTFLVSVLPSVEQGQVVGTIGIGTDVTHLTELERQLAQSSRLESIGSLAAGIAHEINTPVQYICDNTRFVADMFGSALSALEQIAGLVDGHPGTELADRVADVIRGIDLPFVADEVPSALSQSLEGLDRVAEIVRAMKEFSHPGRGRVDTDLNRAVDTTVQVSRNEWKYEAELTLDLDPAVGLVPCVESEIKQVVLNIVVNAAQAVQQAREKARRSRPGEPPVGHLVVATRRTGDHVTISVSDDGVGMDRATVERVFDPFFTTKDVGHGTGQGLSMAHSIVGRHGGRIDVRSVPGEGTTFVVTLPTSATRTDGQALAAAAGGIS